MDELGQVVSASAAAARCAIHPRYLHPKGGPFDAKYFLDLKRHDESFNYKTSVGSREFLPAVADVHEYGCKSAAISNEERAAAGKDVTPRKTAAHYIGFYNIQVADVESQSNEVYSVYVEHWPEKGQKAHCHIVLQENPELSDEQRKLKSFHRTNVITGLWEHMSGPFRHICECDEEHREFLALLDLPDPAVTSSVAEA